MWKQLHWIGKLVVDHRRGEKGGIKLVQAHTKCRSGQCEIVGLLVCSWVVACTEDLATTELLGGDCARKRCAILQYFESGINYLRHGCVTGCSRRKGDEAKC